jgi:hypothetical protein
MLRDFFTIAEAAITKLGVDPEACADLNQPGTWNLKKGSATIEIRFFSAEGSNSDDDRKIYCMVSAWVAKIPTEKKVEFYEELLELNAQYVGVTFCKLEADAYVVSSREAVGMDEQELTTMIYRVSNTADYHDDLFQQKYPA